MFACGFAVLIRLERGVLRCFFGDFLCLDERPFILGRRSQFERDLGRREVFFGLFLEQVSGEKNREKKDQCGMDQAG